jgi:hypothetical protein
MPAPIAAVTEHFGFTVERVVAAAKQAIAGRRSPVAEIGAP